MASSTLSLDSLSSPSPSPSPPPAGKKQSQTANKAISSKDAATGPALDSDSELSELTDDDQDGTASGDKRERPASALAASSSKAASAASASASANALGVSSLVDEGVSAASSSNAMSRASATAKRGSHQRNSSTSRRGGARKKRSSIVPAPMWGWAESKATSSSAPVEEEEEEIVGPPRAMEEEEEDPDEEEEEGSDASHHGDDSAGIDEDEEEGGFVNPRRLGPYVNQRLPGISARSFYPYARHKRRVPLLARTRYDNVDQDVAPNFSRDNDEEASASGSEYASHKRKKPAKVRAATSKRRKGSMANESSGSERPHPSPKKVKKPQTYVEADDGENASDGSAAQAQDGRSGDDDTQDDTEDAPRIPHSPTKTLAGSKPLSFIANSAMSDPATAALTALAVIAADAVEPSESKSRDVDSMGSAINSSSTAPRPSSAHNLPSANANPSSNNSVDQTPVVSRSRTASPDNDDEGELIPESLPVQRGKRGGRRGQNRQRKASDDWRRLPKVIRSPTTTNLPRKGPPAPLDLKVIVDLPGDPSADAGVEDTEGIEAEDEVVDETNDGDKDVDMEGEEEVEEGSQHDEEDHANGDEEPGEADDEPADLEAEVDGEEDQEQDLEVAEVENEQENEPDIENDLEGENDEDPLPDGDLEDQEIELQPAHRAEALDVLASIELKFARLRERVYVEKMETLAWEEAMVQASVHPELQYLQKEMTKRRDKRLELATRRCSYEAGNATKRRKADEDGVWSWWKLAVDDLQTEIIAETNRKRRRLERDRRALERPQPIRRIPRPQHDFPLHPPPSLRKILKSYPFEARKRTKGRRYRYHTQQPKNLIYPEISTLSAMDIANDLEFLYQNRRMPSAYDGQFGGTATLWGPNSPFGNRNVLTSSSSVMPGMARPMGVGLNGGLPPPQAQPMMSLPPPGTLMSQHHPNYGHYGDMVPYGPPGRPPMGVYAHGPPHPPGAREPYAVFSGAPSRNQPSSSSSFGPPPIGSSSHGYPMEHEMSMMGPNVNAGHQLMPPHPYFGHGNGGQTNSFPASSLSHPSGKGVLNGRRSPSPPHGAPNGLSGSKTNGNWVNLGMSVGSFQVGSSNSGKGGDLRVMNEDDERDRAMMRERDRRRHERDKEIDRRDVWDKEYGDLERDRMRDPPHMQQHNSSHPPLHSSGGTGQVEPHHHHHRPHHHHILHRHAPPPPIPSPGPSGGGGVPPIVHSPRSARDYEAPRPPSAHLGQSHPTTEIITLSSNKSHQPGPRERDGPWPSRNIDTSVQHSPVHDYRDKELRKPYSHRPSSRPHLDSVDDRGDRSMSAPFVTSSHPMPSAPPPAPPHSHMNGRAPSPKGQPVWNGPPEDSYRMLPGGYLGGPSSHDAHRSPIQTHRYTPGGPSSLTRGIPPSSSSHHRMASPPPPSNRTRPPQSPTYSHPRRSPPTSPKMRPMSPVSNKPLLGPGRTTSPSGQRPASSHAPSSSNVMEPHLKSANLPTYPSNSRTGSPLMTSLHLPSNRQNAIGNGNTRDGPDLERHHISTLSPRNTPSGLAPPSKLHAAQVTDRR